jgi:hypothetical protein
LLAAAFNAFSAIRDMMMSASDVWSVFAPAPSLFGAIACLASILWLAWLALDARNLWESAWAKAALTFALTGTFAWWQMLWPLSIGWACIDCVYTPAATEQFVSDFKQVQLCIVGANASALACAILSINCRRPTRSVTTKAR